MDPSTNPTMNAPQHGDPSYNTNNPNYLDGLSQFADPTNLHSNDEFSAFFDPALFETSALGPGFSQQTQPVSQNTFNQNTSRQSNSPGLSHFTNSPQPAFQQNQYSQPLYNNQPLQQPAYDPRFFVRPSQSPVSYDAFSYHPQMGYSPQPFNQQQLNIPPRQSTTPTPNYQQRQQPPPSSAPQYANIAQRQPQMSQGQQSADMMQFGTYHDHNHQPSSTFIDPTMLSATPLTNTSAEPPQLRQPSPYAQGAPNIQNYQAPPPQSYLQPTYYKASSMDPRFLNGGSMLPTISPNPPPAPPLTQAPAPLPIAKGTPHVPKAKGATKAAPKKPEQGSDTGSDSSDDELAIEEDEPETIPAVLAVSPPTDERGKLLYNAVSAVWSPRNRNASVEKIRTGIASFGDTVRGLRDSWKARNDSLRKAELPDSATAADVSSLKEEVTRYRSIMETLTSRALLHGHPAIVKRLGENQFTMSALYSFMLDRFNAGDYDSSLVSNIFKFVVKFETLDTEMLEMTKVSKILQRFTKKATNESKALAQTILNNAAAASSKKLADGKSEKVASPQVVDSPGVAPRKEMATGMKRARESDTTPPVAVKKPTKVSSKPLALQNAERRKALEAAQAAKGGDKTVSTASPAASSATHPSTAPLKGKVAVAPPTRSAVFGSLMSASKKPGTSIAARAAAAKDKPSPTPASSAAIAKEAAKRDSPPRNTGVPGSKNTSSFLGLLADMEKKPEKVERKESDTPNETEEERAKRLRKEARRKLRVTWKADTELTEVRLFTHDPDEEVGHNDSQVRDVGDIGSEGEMLKKHQGVDEEDDDEDGDSFEDLEPYTPPSEVDFSGFVEEGGEVNPFMDNFSRFGGSMKPESPSSEAQNKHEQDTVMAVYASKSDRPPTPKEPDDDDGEFEPAEPEVPFGEPNDKVRRREKEHIARQNRTKSQAIALGQTVSNPTGGLSTDLQQFLGNLRSQQSQPTIVPQQPPANNYQNLLSSVEMIKLQLQGQNTTPQYQAPAPAPVLPVNLDLGAILASLQQQQQQQQPQPPQSQPPMQNQTASLALGFGTNPNPYPGASEDQSRKHGRTDFNDHDDYGRKGGAKKKKATAGTDQARPYNYKTQICSFWEQGKCQKGEKCTYLHGNEQ